MLFRVLYYDLLYIKYIKYVNKIARFTENNFRGRGLCNDKRKKEGKGNKSLLSSLFIFRHTYWVRFSYSLYTIPSFPAFSFPSFRS